MARKLTHDEIEYIVNCLPENKVVFDDISKSQYETLQESLRNQLTQIKLYPQKIPDLIKRIVHQYYQSLAAPGEMVGVVAAGSIGEPSTQSTLNTFHYAGVSEKSVTSGVVRIKELVGVTQNPKNSSATIRYKNPIQNLDQFREKCKEIVYIPFENIVKQTINFKWSTMEDVDEWYYFSPNYNLLCLDQESIKFKHVIRFYLNTELLFKYDLGMEEITQILCKYIDENGQTVIHSGTISGIIDVVIDIDNTQEKKQQLLLEMVKNMDTDNLDFEKMEDALESIYIRMFKNMILKLPIRGIPGIEKAYPVKKGNEWEIETDGSNLREILTLPDVDYTRTTSNHVWEIYNTLGIEACISFLVSELNSVLNTFLHPAHIRLLVDSMTFSGIPTPATEFGIDRSVGPFAKAGFEKVLSQFMNAAFAAQNDKVDSVSSSVVLGKTFNGGAGHVDIVSEQVDFGQQNIDKRTEEYMSEKIMKLKVVERKR